MTLNKGTGCTSHMLQSLPVENTPVVVVHTLAMYDYVRDLARQLRPDLRHPIRVRIVRDTLDCKYLRGIPFVVDHALLEQASSPVISLLQALGKRRELTMWEGNPCSTRSATAPQCVQPNDAWIDTTHVAVLGEN